MNRSLRACADYVVTVRGYRAAAARDAALGQYEDYETHGKHVTHHHNRKHLTFTAVPGTDVATRVNYSVLYFNYTISNSFLAGGVSARLLCIKPPKVLHLTDTDSDSSSRGVTRLSNGIFSVSCLLCLQLQTFVLFPSLLGKRACHSSNSKCLLQRPRRLIKVFERSSLTNPSYLLRQFSLLLARVAARSLEYSACSPRCRGSPTKQSYHQRHSNSVCICSMCGSISEAGCLCSWLAKVLMR